MTDLPARRTTICNKTHQKLEFQVKLEQLGGGGNRMNIQSTKMASAVGAVAAAGVIGASAYGARNLTDRVSDSAGQGRPESALALTGIASAGTVALAGLASVMIADRGRTSVWAAAPALTSGAKFGAEALRSAAWTAVPLGLAAMAGVALINRD
ncbi:MAG: hypothetical protein JWM86_2980 [Thermoleophilia bacterium]|nr:hypothetical protein [Thermoleophilia bacterium]